MSPRSGGTSHFVNRCLSSLVEGRRRWGGGVSEMFPSYSASAWQQHKLVLASKHSSWRGVRTKARQPLPAPRKDAQIRGRAMEAVRHGQEGQQNLSPLVQAGRGVTCIPSTAPNIKQAPAGLRQPGKQVAWLLPSTRSHQGLTCAQGLAHLNPRNTAAVPTGRFEMPDRKRI